MQIAKPARSEGRVRQLGGPFQNVVADDTGIYTATKSLGSGRGFPSAL
jgi:hypothetical protein